MQQYSEKPFPGSLPINCKQLGHITHTDVSSELFSFVQLEKPIYNHADVLS